MRRRKYISFKILCNNSVTYVRHSDVMIIFHVKITHYYKNLKTTVVHQIANDVCGKSKSIIFSIGIALNI